MTSAIKIQEFQFDGFVLVPALMRLECEGEPVALPHNAFQALMLLVENRNRIVTKQELLNKIWTDTSVEENALNQCISVLRKIFGDTRREARYIATISGVGYRFVREVAERERVLPAVYSQPVARVPSLLIRLSVALGFILCVAAGAAAWRAISRPDAAVLILPIEAIGPSQDSEYIRSGLTTEIEASLARGPGLHVATGVPAALLKKGDVREIAQRMNVGTILRGHIRQNSGVLLLTMELVNAMTERILWSDQFGVRQDDLASAESRIVAGVFQTLQPGRAAPEPRKVNSAAHDLYLRGRQLAWRRMPADLDKAIGLYEKAVAIDPTYADAYTGIADASGLEAVNGPAPAGALEKARAAALRAIELDGGSPAAHNALGLVYYADWNWMGARRELQEALRLNPYDPITHHRLALLNYVFGDYRGAEDELKKAMELNPYNAAHAYTLAEVYVCARKYDDVIRTSEFSLKQFPASSYPHFLEMEAYHALGNGPAALSQLRTANQIDGTPALKALVDIDEGRIDAAKRMAKELGTEDMFWVWVYAQLGERDRMLSILRHLIDTRSVIVVGIKDDPIYDRYRQDPEFQQLISGLRLPISR